MWRKRIMSPTGMRNNIRPVLLSFLAALCLLCVSGTEVRAAEPLAFEYTEFVFDGDRSGDREWFYTADGCVGIKDAVCSSQVLKIVKKESSSILVKPLKAGSAVITATGTDGSKAAVRIRVKNSYFKRQLEDSIWFSEGLSYGSSRTTLYAMPGAKGTLVIGKDRYSVALNAKGRMKIRFKRTYKLKTKVKLTLRLKGQTVTVKDRIRSDTFVRSVKGAKKKFTVDCFNLHRGDTVRITHRGRTYTKKIRKKMKRESGIVRFAVKKTVRKNGKFRVRILNRYGQELFDSAARLYGRECFYTSDGRVVTDPDEED